MQRLAKRLAPIKNEVLKVYEVEGIGGILVRGYCKDPESFERWRKEVTNNGDSKTPGKFSYGGVQSLLDRTLQTFIETVVTLKATNEELRKENEYLKAQLNNIEWSHTDKLLELVEICK